MQAEKQIRLEDQRRCDVHEIQVSCAEGGAMTLAGQLFSSAGHARSYNDIVQILSIRMCS